MNNRVVFVIPCYNAEPNIKRLVSSLISQTDNRWSAIFIDDVSDKKLSLESNDERITVVNNNEKKYALRNIVETVCDKLNDDDIVAVIDGDDSLCNDETVSLLLNAYDVDDCVAWTAHKWDINGMNISCSMPNVVDPYQYKWCSSHLKTFRAALLKRVPKQNFFDENGQWFKRGYDQALMLPLLRLAKKRCYIDVVCYAYNINSCSLSNRDWAERDQLKTVKLIRARGFLDG